LDADRADLVALVLAPLSVLSERHTPVGIYQFCLGIQQIARERQVEATRMFELLLERFQSPRYYPTLPKDARVLYMAALWFAIGAFALFRAESRRALTAADALDASGLKIYAMIASQLRYLYHFNRGELEQAAPHREQVELHAVQVGAAAQVERWESPALIPLSIMIGDVVSSTRAVHRLGMDASASYMRPYRLLAKSALELLVDSPGLEQTHEFLMRELKARKPRYFIGWATTHSAIARKLLAVGNAAAAEALCRAALAHVDDADREYVLLFLDLDMQLAHALAAQGKHEQALAQLDALLARFAPSGHPLALGLLHEARGRICHAAGARDGYLQSAREAERWLRPTNMPLLIAKCERLWELSGRHDDQPAYDPYDPASGELTQVDTVRSDATVIEPKSDQG
jgi:hypothetical protein